MSPISSLLGSRPAPLPLPDARRLRLRRLVFVWPSLVLASILVSSAIGVLVAKPHGWFDWTLLIPFSIAMSWEALIVWQLVLGFVQWMRGSEGLSPIEKLAATVEPQSSGNSRTALLLPIYEEDVAAVFAAVGVMLRSLARLGPCEDIEVHVLSDTRSVSTAAAEAEAARRAVASFPGFSLHYRRRDANTGRKAGNIADFLGRHGDRFDFSVVLDADSLMTGEAIRRLIRTMEASPRVGLVQTVSYAAGRSTLFARIQQFAIRLHAPLALRGLHYWQGPEGSYWGHNAIFRVAPFMTHCRLPVLPGRPPLGGEILCHDIIEGALLARAGWEVHLLPDFGGTWEEMPTNTLDLLARERRWCQGNLQHLGLLTWPGLKPASRAHLAFGIGGYLVVPIWWAFLLGGSLRVLVQPCSSCGLLGYGISESGPAAAVLVTASLLLVAAPRVLNLICALSPRVARAGFGGAPRLLLSAAVEQLFALLLGPTLSLACAGFVLQILAGSNSGWKPQARSDRRVPLGEAWRWHRNHVCLGCLLLVGTFSGAWWYGIWMLPAALGLTLSPWITVLASSRDLGRWSQRRGLFVTLDDLSEAVELQELHARSCYPLDRGDLA